MYRDYTLLKPPANRQAPNRAKQSVCNETAITYLKGGRSLSPLLKHPKKAFTDEKTFWDATKQIVSATQIPSSPSQHPLAHHRRN